MSNETGGADGRVDALVGRLLHYWRLLTEPDTQLMTGAGRWRVRYRPNREWPFEAISVGMSYRQACNYAEMFDGTVERVTPNAEAQPRICQEEKPNE